MADDLPHNPGERVAYVNGLGAAREAAGRRDLRLIVPGLAADLAREIEDRTRRRDPFPQTVVDVIERTIRRAIEDDRKAWQGR